MNRVQRTDGTDDAYYAVKTTSTTCSVFFCSPTDSTVTVTYFINYQKITKLTNIYSFLYK